MTTYNNKSRFKKLKVAEDCLEIVLRIIQVHP